MISGLDESYKKATIVTDKMKREMEENAINSEIQMGSNTISLSDVLVEGSSLISPCKSVSLIVFLDQNIWFFITCNKINIQHYYSSTNAYKVLFSKCENPEAIDFHNNNYY